MIMTMHAQLWKDQLRRKPFEGLRIYTCAHRRSIINQQQYTAHWDQLGLEEAVQWAGTRGAICVRCREKSIGILRIQIPFSKPRLVVDVYYLVLKISIPTGIYVRHMIENRFWHITHLQVHIIWSKPPPIRPRRLLLATQLEIRWQPMNSTT